MIWESVLWMFIQAALRFFLPKLEPNVGPVVKEIILFILSLIGGASNQAETAAQLKTHLQAFSQKPTQTV